MRESGRVLGRRLLEAQSQEPAERQRIGGPPRNAALRVDALEIADQQQAEVGTRRQAGPAHLRRIERRALRFHEVVEPVLVEDLIQALIERVATGLRQLIGRDPQRRCPRSILAPSHGHAEV